jgi:hypothetical protein
VGQWLCCLAVRIHNKKRTPLAAVERAPALPPAPWRKEAKLRHGMDDEQAHVHRAKAAEASI